MKVTVEENTRLFLPKLATKMGLEKKAVYLIYCKEWSLVI